MNNQTKFKQTAIGMIPEDWEVKKIKDIGVVITGKTPPTEIKEYFGLDFPFIRIPDMGKSIYIDRSEMMLSKKGSKYLKNIRLPKDSVMVSCLATVGKAGITVKDSFTNQQINSLICNKNKVIPLWVYYFFKNNISYLESLGGGGSVYTNISKSKFENSLIYKPKIEEQEKIVKILSALDEKIELNQNMNKTIEAIAQVIFKCWFIDFEFPNESGEPYKSSGGEMTDSELGPIPKEWVVIPFKEIIKISSGKRPKASKKEKDIKFIIPLIGASSIMGYVSEILFIEPILVIGRVGTHGVVQRTKEKSWPSDNTLVIQSVYYEYTYQILKNIDYQSLNRGSTQPLITQTDIKKYKIIFPKNNLIKDFEKSIDSLFQLINKNKEENIVLSGIRDKLLPKLMSGEIRVSINIKEGDE